MLQPICFITYFYLIATSRKITIFASAYRAIMKTAISIVALLGLILLHFTEARASYPLVRNFTRRDYKGAHQNWAITQHPHGIMFFGNKDALFVFNGASWDHAYLDNYSALRSLLMDGERLYAGGSNIFGYFSSGADGCQLHEQIRLGLRQLHPPCGRTVPGTQQRRQADVLLSQDGSQRKGYGSAAEHFIPQRGDAPTPAENQKEPSPRSELLRFLPRFLILQSF